jgi:ubiquinone/menaquinone biosynthesis C-methylase UbiE
MSGEQFWSDFWDQKARRPTDFQATGRGGMDVPGFLYTVREIANALILTPDDEVLDIGCGTGIVALALSPWVRRIHGVDISSEMIARAKLNTADARNVTLAVGSITETHESAGAYDKVLAYSVLQYLPDISSVERAFEEIARVLKPGGRALLAANPDPARRDSLIAAINEKSDPEIRRLELDSIARTGWFSGEQLVAAAANKGLCGKVAPIHSRIWQHFYMFDLVVERDAA